MTFKAVLSDLDGTLLTSNHNFSSFTRKVVQAVQKTETKFIIATGRHHIDVLDLLKSLDITTTIITSNGARIHNEKGQVILRENLSPTIAKEILQNFPYEKYPNIRANIYREDQWITSLPVSKELEHYHQTTSFKGEVGNLKNLDSYEDIIKIFFNTEPMDREYKFAQKDLHEIEREMVANHADEIIVTAPLPAVLEVNSANATKGQAMKRVMAEKGIDLRQVLAFGDGFNDYDMLKGAGKGLIMGNAHYTLKDALPHLEIIETCDEDAVAKYLVFSVLLTGE